MRQPTKVSIRRLRAACAALGLTVSGCSDHLYFDRRETVHLGADDAVAINKVTHMYDPWPPGSGDRYIPGNGNRVAGAIERYRTNRVTPPARPATSSVGYAPAPPAPPPAPAASASANQ
jgi:hypothetical protein